MRRKKDIEFRFKQFSVQHDRSTMKVGTDAVLIGAWADVTNVKQILEVGTGSGVIALMLAQRTGNETQIGAIEIDPESVIQAKENVGRSPWPEKITIHSSSFQKWNSKKKYDLIISNPPFFSNSLLPPDEIRTGARHNIKLSSIELLSHSKRLIASSGRLAVVLPFEEGNGFVEEAVVYDFHLNRKLAFFTRQEMSQERWLMEFSFQRLPVASESITLYSTGNQLTDKYKQLTSDFYLNL